MVDTEKVVGQGETPAAPGILEACRGCEALKRKEGCRGVNCETWKNAVQADALNNSSWGAVTKTGTRRG